MKPTVNCPLFETPGWNGLPEAACQTSFNAVIVSLEDMASRSTIVTSCLYQCVCGDVKKDGNLEDVQGTRNC